MKINAKCNKKKTLFLGHTYVFAIDDICKGTSLMLSNVVKHIPVEGGACGDP
jgi:hypothetical protein